jgi:cytidine deaminase
VPWQLLEREALAARRAAYAPYSRYRVGAALLVDDEFGLPAAASSTRGPKFGLPAAPSAARGPNPAQFTIVRGCNVENASYGLSVCAERNALTTAVAAGHRRFRAMAVATGASPAAPSCGMCLQFMAELCVDLELLLVNPAGERRRTSLLELMPHPFRWKGVGT